MADEKKKKPTRIITPRFIAMWAWISKPNTRNDKDGKYEVAGIFDPKVPEHRAFLKQLTTIHKENVEEQRKKFKATKKDPQMKVQSPIEEQEDGKFLVRFSESAFIDVTDKVTQEVKRIDLKPLVVDAKGQATDVEVWTGSTIKVAVDVMPFYNGSLGAGLSRRLKGVQVIELRTRGSRDGASLGFGVEDGGFSSDEQPGDEEAANEFTDETAGATSAEPELVEEQQVEAPAPAADDFDF